MLSEKVARRIAERMAGLDGIPYPPDVRKTVRIQIAREELAKYEAEIDRKRYGSGLPEQWSELIPDFEPDYSNAVAIARGHRLG